MLLSISLPDPWEDPFVNDWKWRADLLHLIQVVLALDADFIVSEGLHESLSQPSASSALLEDVSIQRNVIVIPAFETEGSLGLEKGGEIATLAQKGTFCQPLPCLCNARSMEA